MSDDLNKDDVDPVLVAISTALVSLTTLLRHITVDGYMSKYDASCAASDGIRALSGALMHMNI